MICDRRRCISAPMTDTTILPRPEAAPHPTGDFLVAALYHFARLPRFESLRDELFQLCRENGVKGTLLLAAEGINGTIAGRMRVYAPYLPSCVHSRNLRRWNTRKAGHRTCPSCA